MLLDIVTFIILKRTNDLNKYYYYYYYKIKQKCNDNRQASMMIYIYHILEIHVIHRLPGVIGSKYSHIIIHSS